MSYATLILGESGTGKSASLRNLDPSKVLLIQAIAKPLPFKAPKLLREHTWVCSDSRKIVAGMKESAAEIIIIDDFQYILSMMYMDRRNEKGFDKFNDIGGAGYDIFKTATQIEGNKRIYILSHIQTDDLGNSRIKTIGKMLDATIVLEGLVTTVLKTVVENRNYMFSTRNSGHDTVKSPMGMFSEALIENDLAAVDKAICDYYEISSEPEPEPEPAAESKPETNSSTSDKE